MNNLKAKLSQAIKNLTKASHVDPEAVKRVKKVIEASQKQASDLKYGKG